MIYIKSQYFIENAQIKFVKLLTNYNLTLITIVIIDLYEETPDGVEVVYRGSGEDAVRILMNHNAHAVEDGAYKLAPFESRIEKL